MAEASKENAPSAPANCQRTADVHDTCAATAGSSKRAFFDHWCGRRAPNQRRGANGGGRVGPEVCSDPMALMVSPMSKSLRRKAYPWE